MLHIYVIERGFVVVGQQTDTDRDEITLDHASIVRRWGTTAGLGQLANNGPLTDTVLDSCPRGVKFPHRALIMALPCAVEPWGQYMRDHAPEPEVAAWSRK